MEKIKSILVVEDDAQTGTMLVDLFKMEASWQAFLVTNAAQALEAVKTVVPDLFVLDYQLPGINGVELADRLHAIEKLKHVPFLFLSAKPPEQELRKRQIACLQKPFQVEALLRQIRRLLAE